VIYSIAGDDFRDFITKKLNERTKKLADSRNMNIKMDPEIYRIYKDTKNISGKCPVSRIITNLI